MFFTVALFLLSCQKELDSLDSTNPGINPVLMKPKIGTTWTYRYDTFYSFGGLISSVTVVHKAISEETYGGEAWLNVIDTATNTTVYLLNVKTGGLYQYANNAAYLFCKDSAQLNDTYVSYNEGAPETFVVKGVGDSLPGYLGTLAVNYYEGTKGSDLIDEIWYNQYQWIVQRVIYFRTLSGTYYRRHAMYLTQIKY